MGINQKDNVSPLMIHGPGMLLVSELLKEKPIHYTDDRFPVSSDGSAFILKLHQEKEAFVLFYTQIPYIYPIPDDLKQSVQSYLETLMKKPVTIAFINAGTQAQKERILRGEESAFQDKETTEALAVRYNRIAEEQYQQKTTQPAATQKKNQTKKIHSFLGFFKSPVPEKKELQNVNSNPRSSTYRSKN